MEGGIISGTMPTRFLKNGGVSVLTTYYILCPVALTPKWCRNKKKFETSNFSATEELKHLKLSMAVIYKIYMHYKNSLKIRNLKELKMF